MPLNTKMGFYKIGQYWHAFKSRLVALIVDCIKRVVNKLQTMFDLTIIVDFGIFLLLSWIIVLNMLTVDD